MTMVKSSIKDQKWPKVLKCRNGIGVIIILHILIKSVIDRPKKLMVKLTRLIKARVILVKIQMSNNLHKENVFYQLATLKRLVRFPRKASKEKQHHKLEKRSKTPILKFKQNSPYPISIIKRHKQVSKNSKIHLPKMNLKKIWPTIWIQFKFLSLKTKKIQIKNRKLI